MCIIVYKYSNEYIKAPQLTFYGTLYIIKGKLIGALVFQRHIIK